MSKNLANQLEAALARHINIAAKNAVVETAIELEDQAKIDFDQPGQGRKHQSLPNRSARSGRGLFPAKQTGDLVGSLRRSSVKADGDSVSATVSLNIARDKAERLDSLKMGLMDTFMKKNAAKLRSSLLSNLFKHLTT